MSDEVVPRLESIVIDCADVDRLVTFWRALLNVDEARRFPGFVWLAPSHDGAPSLAFQRVPEPKAGKNRVHLDFSAKDREGLIAQVESLGGGRVEDQEIQGFHWTVLADPEGNEFCVAGA